MTNDSLAVDGPVRAGTRVACSRRLLDLLAALGAKGLQADFAVVRLGGDEVAKPVALEGLGGEAEVIEFLGGLGIFPQYFLAHDFRAREWPSANGEHSESVAFVRSEAQGQAGGVRPFDEDLGGCEAGSEGALAPAVGAGSTIELPLGFTNGLVSTAGCDVNHSPRARAPAAGAKGSARTDCPAAGTEERGLKVEGLGAGA